MRYRALLPILALEEQNVKSHLFGNGGLTNLDGLDALIIIKSFSIEDVCLAQEARVRGIPLVFALCDNIFLDGYFNLFEWLLFLVDLIITHLIRFGK